ncbi:MAG: FtsH protease activity modulator HflK [Undibacterium sp.]|nr:FtsH protease activity modulator HflK [Undibacterium sp.]
MRIPFLKRLKPLLSSNDPERGSKEDRTEGKKTEDGPPDLDQLWRDFNQAINRLLGKNGGEGGGNTPNRGNEANVFKIALSSVLSLIVFLWLVSGFFMVGEGEAGLVTTFGKYDYKTGAGFNWRWPSPIQAHEIINEKTVRTIEIGYRGNVKNKKDRESLMLTDDENIIDIQFAVQYTVGNAVNWAYNNRDQEKMISQVAETSIREIVGRSTMDSVLYEGREKLARDMKPLMQTILDRYKSGVKIDNVTMATVQPPEQVQVAFDDAMKAVQDKVRQKNEGQAYANNVIPKARGEAARILQDAEGYRSSIVANAEGNVARFKQVLVEYQKAPAITRDRMYLETMQQIFSNTSKLMMDAKSGNNMLYLPLDKLMLPSDGGAQRTPAAGSGPSADAVTTIEVHGNRDAKDSRSESRARDPRDREVR